jgi:HPt (histidine-containing phosphotransfer) domain-containing protein
MAASNEERIAALFQSYREVLPGRMHEMESKWEELKQGWNPPCAVELERAFHSIAGTAPTFDLPEIGEAARAIEHDIRAIIKGEADFNSAMIHEIDVKIHALRNTMLNSLS